jgi:general secretion pathway protein B
MSYILDALRKAESDRHSGAIPAIDAPVAPFLAPPSSRRMRWLWVGPLGLVIAGIALARLDIEPQKDTGEKEVKKPLPVVAPRVEEPPAAPAEPDTPLVAPAARPPAPVSIDKPIKNPIKKPVKKSIEKPSKKPTQADPVAATTIPAPVAEKSLATANAPKAAPAEPPLPALRELPQHIQREIPVFAVDGYIYSGNKAGRSVLSNRRLLREGDQIAPGLILERMTPKGMVMNYNGHRYHAPY